MILLTKTGSEIDALPTPVCVPSDALPTPFCVQMCTKWSVLTFVQVTLVTGCLTWELLASRGFSQSWLISRK